MFPLHIVSVVCVDVAGGFAAESKETEDLTGNGSGSKHCEFQGCPNLLHFMCLFIKPGIFGTAALATGRPNPACSPSLQTG